MDRNSLIGFAIITAILVGFYFINKPSQSEIEAQKRAQDSVIAIQDSVKKISEQAQKVQTLSADSIPQTEKTAEIKTLPDEFARFSDGNYQLVTVENDLLKLKISPKGAKVVYIELKKYKTFDGRPLVLRDSNDGNFGYQFSYQNQILNSEDLIFAVKNGNFAVTQNDSTSVVFEIVIDSTRILRHIYSIKGNDYKIGLSISMQGFDKVIPVSVSYIDLYWTTKIRQTERFAGNQKMMGTAPTIFYKYADEKPDKISETKNVSKDISGKIQWLAFQQHFFSQTMINRSHFIRGMVKSEILENQLSYLKKMEATVSLPFTHKPLEEYNLEFYYGPNHFATLKKYDLKLENQISLGKGIIRVINVGVVIPTFNFLSKFMGNFGVIILLLTIIIKIVLLPLTYRSYLSTAKMRILKPEIDAIKEKVGKDAAKLQTETMKLYRNAGVSPLGGCLPMLLQMPVLIALFRFFPSSIELRQEAFLWATDLSSYDSIWDFPNGFSIPFYGDHVSLFTLLMTISTLIYTRMNSKMMTGNDAMAKQMQIIQYVMPIMFLGFFNNYSAGLSYYYFLANMLTFGQQYLFKLAINENKLRNKIEENKKKKASKPKSSWTQRLENLQKQQRQKMQQVKKK